MVGSRVGNPTPCFERCSHRRPRNLGGVLRLHSHRWWNNYGTRDPILRSCVRSYCASRATIETALLLRDGPTGNSIQTGDVVVGTKRRFLGRPSANSGLSTSLEVKLPTADKGARAVDVDIRARGGWQVGADVAYFNLGYTWIGKRPDAPTENVWFYAGVWDHRIATSVQVLLEVHGKTAAERHTPNRLGTSVGIKWRLVHRQQIQASIGRSLRSGGASGPDLRVYVGWRRDFS